MTPRTFPAVVQSVYDGDTCDLLCDLGMAVWRAVTVRLSGCNARELRDPGGHEARDHMLGLIPVGSKVTLISLGWDKYGDRIDGRVTLADDRDLSRTMILDGYAASWNGKGARPVPPWPIVVPDG